MTAQPWVAAPLGAPPLSEPEPQPEPEPEREEDPKSKIKRWFHDQTGREMTAAQEDAYMEGLLDSVVARGLDAEVEAEVSESDGSGDSRGLLGSAGRCNIA